VRNIRLAIVLSGILMLQGCVAAGFGLYAVTSAAVTGGFWAKSYWGAKPKILYAINGKELVLHVSTYSSNLVSVQNMTMISAAIIADEKMKCPYLNLTYAQWPNNWLARAIKIDETVAYKCVFSSKHSDNIGSINFVDVKKKLRFEPELVQEIRDRQLIKPSSDSLTYASNDLALESSSELVLSIQRKLIALGYTPGSADGLMGVNTRNAIEKFQAENEMTVSGEPSDALLKAITKKL
jgi:hypothetical protein